jgi:hypothetical protein
LETVIDQPLSHLSPGHHVGDVRSAWQPTLSALQRLKNSRAGLIWRLIFIVILATF